MRVGGAQGGDVLLAARVHRREVKPAGPIDRRQPQDIFQEGVGCNAGMTAIAVRKEVDEYEAMVKSNSGFRRPVNLMRNPVPGIVEQNTQLDLNLGRIDTDVLLGRPKFSRPPPHLAE